MNACNHFNEMCEALKSLYGDTDIPAGIVDEQFNVLWHNQAGFPFFNNWSVRNWLFPLLGTNTLDELFSVLRKHRHFCKSLSVFPLVTSSISITAINDPVSGGLAGALITIVSPILPDGDSLLTKMASDYISNFSQNMRDPLSMVLSAVNLLKEQMGQAEGKALHALSVIHQNSYQILRSVTNIVATSSYLNGKSIFEPKPVELTHYLEDLFASLLIKLDAISLPFSYTLPDYPLWTELDPVKMGAAILQIISNSCKFTRPGNQIAVDVRYSANDVLIKIVDCGTGISQQNLPMVFLPYFSAANTPEQLGMGLGLSIAQQILHMHHGDIQIESRENIGTTVQLRFTIEEHSERPATFLDGESSYFSDDPFAPIHIILADAVPAPF